jgi:hypothetical protein
VGLKSAIPSPTPDLVPLAKVAYPKIYAVMSAIPESVVASILSIIGTLIIKKVWDTFHDKGNLSVQNTILEMFSTFQEQHAKKMEAYAQKAHGDHLENLIEVKKLDKSLDRVIIDFQDIKDSIEKLLDKATDQEKRIMRLEHRDKR